MEVYREPQKDNDLYFTCFLIEHIARATHNKKRYIVNALGMERVEKIYELADVYHCENIEKVTEEFITEAKIEYGTEDIVVSDGIRVPTDFEIGRVYQRLILDISKSRKQDPISVLFEVYNSWIADKIDNYMSSMYYSNPDYILACYIDGKIL